MARSIRPFIFAALGACLVGAVPDPAEAQVFVYPRRPSQSQVRYFHFEWQHIDILVGSEAEGVPGEPGPRAHPELPYDPFWRDIVGDPVQPGDPEPGREAVEEQPLPVHPVGVEDPVTDPEAEIDPRAGGARLYFYEAEREVAEKAAASIAESYDYLIDRFDYTPPVTFPYVLYSSYIEFLTTNLFPLQEGVLGVTSPRDLMVALPYFGDHRLFHDVSTHELAHEFTIQKVNQRVREAEVSGQPLDRIPLWFIEGLAEYYTHDGIDAQTAMMATDLLANPDAERGFVMHDFFEDRIRGFLWTYKMGQVRCAFLEEAYGEGTINEILERSPDLLAPFGERPPAADFKELVSSVVDESPERISTRFEEWVKHRFFPAYLRAEQSEVDLLPIPDGPRRTVQALAASPDGRFVAGRFFDPETGVSQIRLLDERNDETWRHVVTDGVPGVESLHPVAGRNFAIADEALAYVAEARGRDVINVQEIRLRERGGRETFSLGRRQPYPLSDFGLIAAESASFSPTGDRIAFVGLDVDGSRDVFVLDLEDEPGQVRRVTVDDYAERAVSWGPDGIVFSSDATEHGRYNLFLLDPDRPNEVERLTREARDHFDPVALADGRVIFSAYDQGRANLYQVQDDTLLKLTDVPTGLFDPGAGRDDELVALQHRSGRRIPVRIEAQLPEPPALAMADNAEPWDIPRMSLDDAEAYRRFAWENWQLGNLFAAGGGGTAGIVAHVSASASDRLRNHVVMLNVSVLGSLELTDGHLAYIDQQHRQIWGASAFQSLHFRIEEPVEDAPMFLSYERYLGAGAMLRHPFNRFAFLQGGVSAGSVGYAVPPFTREVMPMFDGGVEALRAWDERWEGHRAFQTEGSLSLGYNALRTHWATGPISGNSLLLEGVGNWQPMEGVTFGTVRLDGEQYILLFGRTHVKLQAGAGQTFGDEHARQFYLSSFDTLRGVPYGDLDWLLGGSFLHSSAELQFPLSPLVRIFFLTDIEGVAGFDAGAVAEGPEDLWDRRVLNGVLGVNLGLHPLIFRVHFARPIPIGAPMPADTWVPNLSLAWAWQ